ncbi:hypothetical protein [Cytobacillus gottheilii]|uniref:hypothetical protein n=1 Tax=Cytobacillus gottheilii TaxID=859144 RepID=UPI0024954749|nr:hypothetical protein [Cytobacillus gottheilii]
MEKKTSQWRMSQAALMVLIGSIIVSSIVSPSLAYILGALSGSLLLVLINVVHVIYKKRRSRPNNLDKNRN